MQLLDLKEKFAWWWWTMSSHDSAVGGSLNYGFVEDPFMHIVPHSNSNHVFREQLVSYVKFCSWLGKTFLFFECTNITFCKKPSSPISQRIPLNKSPSLKMRTVPPLIWPLTGLLSWQRANFPNVKLAFLFILFAFACLCWKWGMIV